MKHWFLMAALICLGVNARADHDQKCALDRGTFVATSVVTGSSTTGTAFISANSKRMDGLFFNNTASVVWVGTTSATIQEGHSNLGLGVPVLSSATIALDGIMSDALYFTCNAGVSACEGRVFEGRNR